jgi:16S rRNA processing protein RimM
MGRVAGPYGVRGFVRIQVYTETLDSLLDFEEWLVGRQGGWEHRKVLEADVHGGGLVARFEGINTPEAARVLRGSDVAILRGDLPAPEEDEVYWIDLIGCAVINREGTELGQVTNLLATGANDVLVVVAGSGEVRVERLIPYVAQVVESVDVPARSIRVDWGEDF